MSRNDGRKLEELAAHIEAHLLPPGFEVASRTPVFNEHGVQVAEFDITITGPASKGHMSWLIECRDRPSKGPVPGEWIEQLAGRRARFGFSKVMAVSSTGFSPSALDAAKELGIDLRALDGLSPEDVMSWLPLNAPVVIRDARFSAIRLFAGVHLDSSKVAAPQPLGRVEASAKVLLARTDGEAVSLQDIWRKLINNNAFWNGVKEGGPPQEVTVNALEILQEKYDLVHEDQQLPLEEIQFDATLQIVIPRMPLVEAAEYASVGANPDAQEAFARVGRWKGPEDGLIKELTMIGFLKKETAANEA